MSIDIHPRFICSKGQEIAMKKRAMFNRPFKSRQMQRKPFGTGARRPVLELLEDRSMLAAATFPGNFAPPNLNLDAVPGQTVTAGQQVTLNILTAGGTITDVDGEGDPTNDTIRYYLDPDVGTDTPTGASLTTAGVFTWTPTAAQVGTHRIVVIAVDSGSPALADAETFTVTVSAAIPPAVVDLNGPDEGINTTATFTEGSPQAVSIVDQEATITDDDDTHLESATITLTNRPDGEDESLAVTTTDTAITSNYNATTGVLTLTGSDTVAHYQQVIRSLTYNNDSPEPDTTARVVNVIVNDGTSDSAVATSTVSITPVDDAPSVDLNGPDSGTNFAATFTEGGAAVAIVGANAAIGDVDSANLNSATITITNLLDGTAEILSVDTTDTSITANYTAETGILALSGSDTLAHYQQVLRTLKYSNSSQNPNTTARSITVVVNDGTSNSPVRTSTVTVVRVNSEPDLATISDQNATIGILFELPVTATDPDGDELIYDLDRTGINTPASATITKDNNGQATIRWTPTAEDGAGPFMFRVLVTEQGTDDSFTDQEEFTVEIVTAPPSVDANGDGTGVDFAATFTEGEAAKVIVDTDLSVADFDSTELASATVTLTNLQDGEEESLSVDTTDTAITANYTAATGVLTLTGSDTVENYQMVLRTLKYGNVSEDPGTTARIITIVANDGTADGAPATSTVTVAAVNDTANLVLPAPYNSDTPVEVTHGSTVEFTATATDLDHTLAELFFYLDPDTDIEGTVTQPEISEDGNFLWTADVVGTFTITVLVTDGTTDQPDQQTFTITVTELPVEEEQTNAAAVDAAFDSLV
jgi:hypothetical protein